MAQLTVSDTIDRPAALAPSAWFAKICWLMAGLSLAGAFLNLLAPILVFLFPAQASQFNLSLGHLGAPLTDKVPLDDRLLALGCQLVPAAIASFGLVALARLFRLFAKGSVFSRGAMRALNQVALALFANDIAAIVVQLPTSYFLSHFNPPGHRILSLGLGTDDLEGLFLAGAVLVIASVMAEARRIAADHAEIV